MLLRDLSLIITAIAIIGNLALGILVLRHNPKNETNQTYFVFILFLVVWMISSYIVDENIGAQLQKLSLRVAFVSGLLASYYLFKFSLKFPQQEIFRFRSLPKLLLKILVILFVLLSAFTNLVIIPVEPILNAYFYKEGTLDPVYAICLVILLFGSLYITVRNYKGTTGKERLQLTYLILGLTIPIFFISILTLIAPIFTPNSSEYEFTLRVPFHRTSLISISIYVVTAAYAIIRHRLFGIRVILGEILFWLAGSALVFLFFYGTIVVELRFFNSLTDPLIIFLNVFIALLVFPTLRATNNWLRRTIRKITINVSFDRDHILSEYNKEITQSQATTEIVNSLCRLIDEAYAPKFAGLVLIEQRSSNITAEWRGLNPEELMIAQSEEAITQFFNETSVQKRGPLPGVDLQLLFEFPEYQGVLVLGDRKDTAAYANEDVQFLEQALTYTALNLARTTR